MRDHLRLRLFHYPAVGALEDIDAEIAFTVSLFDGYLMRNDVAKRSNSSGCDQFDPSNSTVLYLPWVHASDGNGGEPLGGHH